jgi:hypothetical protein
MSYSSIAASAGDHDLMLRIAACAAQEGVDTDPMSWAMQHIWQVVSNPEVEASYEYALGVGHENPGGDAGVITDAVLLAQVQPLVLGEPVP